MQIQVKAQPGQVCRLSDSLCVGDSPITVDLTTMVRRRLRDGSLIKTTTKKRGAGK